MTRYNPLALILCMSSLLGGEHSFSDSAYGLQSGSQELVLPSKDQYLMIPNTIQSPLPIQPDATYKTPQNNSAYSTNPILQNPTLLTPTLPKVNLDPSNVLTHAPTTLFQATPTPKVSPTPAIPGEVALPERTPIFGSKEIRASTDSRARIPEFTPKAPGNIERRLSPTIRESPTTQPMAPLSLKTHVEEIRAEVDILTRGLEQIEFARRELDRGVELSPDIQNRIKDFEIKFFTEIRDLKEPKYVKHWAGGQGPKVPELDLSLTQEPSLDEPHMGSDPAAGAEGETGMDANQTQVAYKKEWAQRLERLQEDGENLLKEKQEHSQQLHLLLLQAQMNQEDREHAEKDIPLPPGFPRK